MKSKISSLCVAAIIFIVISCDNKQTKQWVAKDPNILFILVDDLGYKDLSFTGSNFYETPNIDKIANEGMAFTQGYAASRVCSPSRASIMTGKFTARHGITDWIGAAHGELWRKHNRHNKLLPANYEHVLPKQDITIAEAMKMAGYKTFFAGKWHLGEKGSYPEDHGFDINIGGWEKGSPIGGYFSPWKNPNLENKEKGENLSIRLAKETSEFIKKNKDTSFFAFLSFYAVHSPIQTTKTKWEKYRNKAEQLGIKDTGYIMERALPIRQAQDNPIYAGLIEAMDDAVGHVLNTLEELKLDKNTIVIFTSDNGGVASGDNFSTSNLPLRGGKGYQWEGGIREPFIIKVPWLQSNGATNDYPVIGTDFYPTILDLANIKPLPEQHIDGLSLKPLLEGKTITTKRSLYWHYPHYGNQGGEPSSIIRDDHWKLIHYWEDDRNELYNLQEDPKEQTDIADSNIEITKKLYNKLNTWLKSVNAKTPAKDLEYDEALADKRKDYLKNTLLPNLEKERVKILSKDFKPNADWWQSQVTID
ncbi:sulfatase [Sabulilitoribacter arenilitoris]|uniref:Sulfatase n=1 Tax=Wocania arenilitoris TaxID=2044858 RepID=A0AAE3JQL1_9FLAO|nr:sulfatase [Wocania arenilitoris]MCF7569305.1 sulfatase [Wocania arenilitoris]